MKVAALVSGMVTLFIPALAMACPAAARSCCGSSLSEYASTFGVGLLAGVGSVALEAAIRKRKRS